jgi:hypothetical protein
MREFLLLTFISVFLVGGAAVAQRSTKKRSKKRVVYEEVHFEDLVKRYLEKEVSPLSAIEGVYSVSCVIGKRSRNFFTREEQERVIERKDNYARIAILKDRPGSQRDFIEVSLSYRDAGRYPIMGEFNVFADGRGLIYNHFEPDGSTLSFSMTNDTDLIEGEHSVVEGKKTITYRLSFLRIYPSTHNVTFNSY